jgi:hypothetical protein
MSPEYVGKVVDGLVGYCYGIGAGDKDWCVEVALDHRYLVLFVHGQTDCTCVNPPWEDFLEALGKLKVAVDLKFDSSIHEQFSVHMDLDGILENVALKHIGL